MTSRFDLFPPRKTRPPTPAELAKQDGMERAERGANAAWSMAMLEATRAVARTNKRFTSDAVFALYSGSATTRDRRAFGPVMLRAAKLGYCRKAYAPPINSTRRSLHASPRAVWESLIFEGN